MPNTFERISSTELGSNATSVTLSGIPATYTDLIIQATFYNTTTNANTIGVYINGSSTYSAVQLGGNGSTVGASYRNGHGDWEVARLTGTAGAIGAPTFLEITLFGYSSVVQERFHCGLARVGSAESGVEYDFLQTNQDTTVINSITIGTGTANLIGTGSQFAVYGIKRFAP